MHRLLFLPVCLVAFGCQSSQYVTRSELHDMLVLPPSDETSPNHLQRCDLDDLVASAFSSPQMPARAAAALAVADQKIAPLTAALSAIDRAFDVCSNNLANAETTAFKRSYAVSEPGGAAIFRYDFEQGSLEKTGRQLDVAISGMGFLKVKRNDSKDSGCAYTRNGNLFVSKDGNLVLGMGEGYKLEPQITIPKGATDVSISHDGRIQVVEAGKNAPVFVGQFELYKFTNPEGLKLLGGSLFTQTETSGPAAPSKPGENGAGEVIQGFLENSNVDPTKERLRIRFLQNWRATVLRAIDDGKGATDISISSVIDEAK